MTRIRTNDILNRLLVIHGRSLPMYLVDAHPWTRSGQEPVLDVLRHIVADQRAMIDRIAAMLFDRGAVPETGQFPLEFTLLNDLGLDFLLHEAIRYQQADVGAIAECVAALAGASAERALAEEAWGLAKGHLETLRELAPSGTPAPGS